MMKFASEKIKIYLKFSHRVLGVSHIYPASVKTLVPLADAEVKKIFNFYSWPDVKSIPFHKQTFELNTVRTIFVFFSTQNKFEDQLKAHSDMVSKMNTALGGADGDLRVGWITPNAENDFFSVVAQCADPLRIVFFRDEVSAKETLCASGAHTLLQTLSPFVNVSDTNRKRFVWNDFKRMLAFAGSQTRPT